MKLFGALLLLLTISVGSSARGSQNLSFYDWLGNDWELVSDRDGITSYRKSFPDSQVTGVGGATMVNASPAKVIWVLMDHDHKDQWVDKFYSARTLENPSLLSSIQYASFRMPPLIDDRDFVYRYDFRYDHSIDAIVVDVKSVEHNAAPVSQSVGVRGEILMGVYRLYSRDNGRQTFVEVEYLADPKGLLPTWLVNVVQRTWPHKTLDGLRKQVRKPFVKDHPIVTEGLKQMMAGKRK